MGGQGSGHFLPRPPDTLLAEHEAALSEAWASYQQAADRLDGAVRAALNAGCPSLWLAGHLGISATTVTRISREHRPDRWGMPKRIFEDGQTAGPWSPHHRGWGDQDGEA